MGAKKKAGEEQGYVRGFDAAESTMVPRATEDGKKAGRKEVVEWIEQYAIHGSHITVDCMLIDLKIHSPYGKPS